MLAALYTESRDSPLAFLPALLIAEMASCMQSSWGKCKNVGGRRCDRLWHDVGGLTSGHKWFSTCRVRCGVALGEKHMYLCYTMTQYIKG